MHRPIDMHMNVHITPQTRRQVTLVEGESKDVLTAITLRVFDQEKAVAFYNNLGTSAWMGVVCIYVDRHTCTRTHTQNSTHLTTTHTHNPLPPHY